MNEISFDAHIALIHLLASLVEKCTSEISEQHVCGILSSMDSLTSEIINDALPIAISGNIADFDWSNGSQNAEERQQVEDVLKRMTNTLGELAAEPSLATSMQPDSDMVRDLLKYLESPKFHMQICSMVILGNLILSSEDRAVAILMETNVGLLLVQLFHRASSGLVLRTAFEFMQTLAKPILNRPILGHIGLLEAMSRCWSQTVDLQLCSVALFHTRYLFQGCKENVLRFIFGIREGFTTLFDQLRATFQSSDNPTARLQLGLTALEAWYSILSEKASSDSGVANSQRTQSQKLDIDPLISELARLQSESSNDVELVLAVINIENESLTTKAWLTLALMSRHRECTQMLYKSLVDGSGSATFRTTLTDPDGQNPKDRANARFLLNELIGKTVCL